MRPGPLIGAVLLPPLGVYLTHGLGRDFWIAAGLTCLAWAPGVAFALWRVTTRAPVAH